MKTTSALPMRSVPGHVPAACSLVVREDAFGSWLETAEPDARIAYHRGHLMIDRARGSSPLGDKFRRELIAIADRAMALAEDGQMLLVQVRHGESDYSYFAVKTGRLRPRARVTLGRATHPHDFPAGRRRGADS